MRAAQGPGPPFGTWGPEGDAGRGALPDEPPPIARSKSVARAASGTWLTWWLLLVCPFATSFARFRSFGLYEDDYDYIGPPLNWSWQDLGAYTREVIAAWPLGRPIAWVVPQTVTMIGVRTGGLEMVHLLACLVVTINGCLIYALLRRTASDRFALLTALAFCVFPPDTIRSLLHATLTLQTSLMFTLLGALLYRSRWWGLAYALGATWPPPSEDRCASPGSVSMGYRRRSDATGT